MADDIREISKTEFQQLAERNPMLDMIVEEVEWFADDQRRVLGVIVHDKTDRDWSWVMLEKYEDEPPTDKHRASKLDTSVSTRDDARKELFRAMREALERDA